MCAAAIHRSTAHFNDSTAKASSQSHHEDAELPGRILDALAPHLGPAGLWAALPVCRAWRELLGPQIRAARLTLRGGASAPKPAVLAFAAEDDGPLEDVVAAAAAEAGSRAPTWDRRVRAVAALLRPLCNLRRLQLSTSHWETVSVAPLAWLTDLTSLDLSDCNHQRADLRVLASGLRQLAVLKLYLSCPRKQAAQLLDGSGSLRSLDIMLNGAVGALAALTGLTSLVAFGARGDAFDAWAQVLGSLSALLELQMHIDKTLPGEPLFAAIEGLPRLRALRLVFWARFKPNACEATVPAQTGARDSRPRRSRAAHPRGAAPPAAAAALLTREILDALAPHLGPAGVWAALHVCRAWRELLRPQIRAARLTLEGAPRVPKPVALACGSDDDGPLEDVAAAAAGPQREAIWDRRVRAVAALLRPLCNLRRLQLSATLGETVSVAPLAWLTALTSLDLSNCNHQRADLGLLASALRQLAVLKLYGTCCVRERTVQFADGSGSVRVPDCTARFDMCAAVPYPAQQLRRLSGLSQLRSLDVMLNDHARADTLPALATLTQLERLAMYVCGGHQSGSWREPNAIGALSALTGLTSLTAFVDLSSTFDAWARVVRSLRQLRELHVQLSLHLPGEPLFEAIGGLPLLRTLRLVLWHCCWPELAVSEQSADALRGVPHFELHFIPKIQRCAHIAALMRLPNLKLMTWWTHDPARRWLSTAGPGPCCCWDCMPRGGEPPI
ncbi:hypothetical protein MNEG_6488 [Monoraphidium neglectum]|uniref:F-box domain-containing protein n=1 Tax=Monoraphidium neglectum TaxID=145388 RepID=A0A0D2N6D0_9CHLO|nr:hypothetical protein MNEG_6488 [Monoraphidium neglectum]KIZ01476.1 hypothetical protein MNEG_6488 [Monoraphidium neglectum]|eukprot:XP_013900495.1 hypothetical protein MNEG_6488 [Monoraphidium neglectum]